MKRIILVLTVLTMIALISSLVGCSSDGETASEGDTKQSSAQSSEDRAAKLAEKAAKEASTEADKSGKQQYGVVETNKGKIVFQLFPHKAPKTVANFVKLANEGFYDGIKWHRVVPGFVIQGGDPLSKDADPKNDGLGGPGYKIKAEFNDVPHQRGTVAMARAQDPDSAGSQFYICLEPQPQLDGQYTVFGQVVEGMDVVDSIQQYDLMTKVYIEER